MLDGKESTKKRKEDRDQGFCRFTTVSFWPTEREKKGREGKAGGPLQKNRPKKKKEMEEKPLADLVAHSWARIRQGTREEDPQLASERRKGKVGVLHLMRTT